MRDIYSSHLRPILQGDEDRDFAAPILEPAGARAILADLQIHGPDAAHPLPHLVEVVPGVVFKSLPQGSGVRFFAYLEDLYWWKGLPVFTDEKGVHTVFREGDGVKHRASPVP